MAFKENSNFDTPEDNTTIWHFTNFPEFCSILTGNSLFFTRADCFMDPWEGTWPKHYHDPNFWADKISDDGKIAKLLDFFNDSFERRKNYAVSCWHINQNESEPFWKLYSNQIFGIALKSSVGSFKRALDDANYNVAIGKVEYIDFNKLNPDEHLDRKGLQAPLLYKRDVFKHEKEVRAFTRSKDKNIPFSGEQGCTINVDIKELLDGIVISPMAQDWFVRVVKELLIKFDLKDIPCEKSDLYDGPKLKGS